MAVTDLTDSLPYWARQGSGAPGPTGGPEGTPQGGPGSQDWLTYLSQYYGISPQQAAMMMQSGNPADIPSPNAQPMGFEGHVGAGSSNGFPVPPGPAIAASVTRAGGAPPVGAGMLDQSGVARMGGPNGVLNTQPPTGASAPVGAGLPDQSGVTRNPAGVLTPGAPATPTGTGPAAPVAAPAPVAGPLAGGGAAGTAATSNPRFSLIDAPNATAQNSMLSRGVPQGTALNLAGLFGGQGVNPNVPAANAQPVSGVLAPGGMSNAPWSMGPLQKGMVWPNDMGPMTPDQIAGRGLKRRYG